MDYLQIFDKFSQDKDIADLLNEITKLRKLYYCSLYKDMEQHIHNLMRKYYKETVRWNSINQTQPTTYQQAFTNAENFLRIKGVSMIVEKGYKIYLTQDEIALLNQTIRLME